MAVKIEVISGDISKVKADALITTIESGGNWISQIDSVIYRCAGTWFHDQAKKKMPLKHGQTINAKGEVTIHAAFANIVFVVDDRQGPLSDIVYNGLMGASDETKYRSVTIPTIRMGRRLKNVTTTYAIATQQVDGVRRFYKENPHTSIRNVTFVVYQDEVVVSAFKSVLRRQ